MKRPAGWQQPSWPACSSRGEARPSGNRTPAGAEGGKRGAGGGWRDVGTDAGHCLGCQGGGGGDCRLLAEVERHLPTEGGVARAALVLDGCGESSGVGSTKNGENEKRGQQSGSREGLKVRISDSVDSSWQRRRVGRRPSLGAQQIRADRHKQELSLSPFSRLATAFLCPSASAAPRHSSRHSPPLPRPQLHPTCWVAEAEGEKKTQRPKAKTMRTQRARASSSLPLVHDPLG
ncbi:unnamed protein product, partial [Protopolystoma xenopodis]